MAHIMQEFEKLFSEWQKLWFSTIDSPNNTSGWAHGHAWDELVALGDLVVPFIIEKLEQDPDANFPAMCLYDKLLEGKDGDMKLKPTDPLELQVEGEQNRARRTVAMYKAKSVAVTLDKEETLAVLV